MRLQTSDLEAFMLVSYLWIFLSQHPLAGILFTPSRADGPVGCLSKTVGAVLAISRLQLSASKSLSTHPLRRRFYQALPRSAGEHEVGERESEPGGGSFPHDYT